jgi:predicted GIY-YIG superfamily endonuclease
MNGKQIRLFLVDGTPGGLLTAEIMNWTGHVIAAPRTDLAYLLKRPEVQRTGIYLLLGEDPESPGRQMVYIGEGDDVGRRLTTHARDESKDFWDRAVVLTSKDMNLTKAHARYLESRFIALAREAGRSRLSNGTAPDPIQLPEADVSDMEYFLAQAKIVLPVLGVNTFRTTSAPAPASGEAPPPNTSPSFVIDRSGVTATAQEVDGEFMVRAGSTARRTWVGTNNASYYKLRLRNETDGTIVPTADGRVMMFPKDSPYSSPSAAAAVILGRSANGRTEWMIQSTGQTYAHWQDQLLETATTPGEASQ